jgi:hypothetical protein
MKCLFEYYKGSIVVLYWMLNCHEMFVWVLRRIYCVIQNAKLLRILYKCYEGSIVILYWTLTVTSGCMSITKNLLLCYTKFKIITNVVWVLRKIYHDIILNVNCHKWLYEYYEGSIVALNWMQNCYEMFV